ncbi:response regulator transcription factor [Paenibacillus sp. LHD-117]|uniref:response regulator transcription factor n=1 Tax=Paenibacillus sp. LHD-117 TaxID=3071412 RepID=UPI0027DED416|nr:response regulator transcription factor [Paenibacillus sp. LHD-117]MDQ6423242.1 response regulator transcription factor [Paenibacillus sp. LHD-117]
MKKVLLIEDEKNMSRFIELELQYESFSVTVASEGNTGLRFALDEEWDLILLDLMLPGMDGLEICRRVRSIKYTPIIMLSARDSVRERVSGLDCGADDYLPKPFAIEELLARMRVVFRRQEMREQQDDNLLPVLSFLDLRLDPNTRKVSRAGLPIELTKREYDLLSVFLNHANRVLDRETLLDKVWGFEVAVDTNVVDVYVRYLRRKIDYPGESSYIQTLRGIGYVMRK